MSALFYLQRSKPARHRKRAAHRPGMAAILLLLAVAVLAVIL